MVRGGSNYSSAKSNTADDESVSKNVAAIKKHLKTKAKSKKK